MFASLFIFLLLINDLGHVISTTRTYRLKVLFLTALAMVFGTILGQFSTQSELIFVVIFIFGLFLNGFLQGTHLFIERGHLFFLFHLITFNEFTDLPIEPILIFQILSFLLCASSLTFSKKSRLTSFPKEKWTLSSKSTDVISRLLFSFSLITFSLMIHYVGHANHYDKNYWALATFLIVCRYDGNLTLSRVPQRFFGTLLGCLVASFMFFVFSSHWIMITLLVLFSGLTPWALQKNYWLGTLTMTVLVLILIEEIFKEINPMGLPIDRLLATIIGCLAGLFAWAFYKILIFYYIKISSKKAPI